MYDDFVVVILASKEWYLFHLIRNDSVRFRICVRAEFVELAWVRVCVWNLFWNVFTHDIWYSLITGLLVKVEHDSCYTNTAMMSATGCGEVLLLLLLLKLTMTPAAVCTRLWYQPLGMGTYCCQCCHCWCWCRDQTRLLRLHSYGVRHLHERYCCCCHYCCQD